MDHIQLGLVFLEGLALIASPCILPVLPLVLSASADGGKSRPFGIILGFVISFSLFVLLSRELVNAFHINLDIIKYGSLALLFLFGVVLFSSKLSEKFSALTQGAANLGSKLTVDSKGGFSSGVIIGAMIGLIWTPCAGPILAAVLVQVILQKNDFNALILVASFAIGAGAPMLLIALIGRKIMGKLGFFTNHAEAVRKTFGIIIILTVLYLAFGANLVSPAATDTNSVQRGTATSLEKGLSKPYPSPDFAQMRWLNSKPLSMQQLKGKVVLVDFWTYSCINCVRTLPYITAWDQKYSDKGLVIVGIHSPEFEFEKNINSVKTALVQHGINYAVGLDNDLATWQNFNNQYWPAHYLIDKKGQVVYTHSGEGDYDVTENNIRYLLGLKDKVEAKHEQSPFNENQTSETYLGYERAKSFAGEKILKDRETSYNFLTSLPADKWSLSGGWKVGGEKITTTAPGAALRLNFTAKKAFLVMGPANGKPVKVHIKLNGQNIGNIAGKDAQGGVVDVKSNTLYELVSQPDVKSGVLEVTAVSPGLEAYAFTFGN